MRARFVLRGGFGEGDERNLLRMQVSFGVGAGNRPHSVEVHTLLIF